jgi:mono/diheme cytochrome c family protein
MHSPRFGIVSHSFYALALLGFAAGCGGSSPDAETAAESAETAGGEAASGTGEADGPLTDATSPCPADDPSCVAPEAAAGAAPSEALVTSGAAVFDKFCDSCHPGGGEDIGPTLLNIEWSADKMTTQIRKGSRKMKPIPAKRLSDEKLGDLMAYLVSIKSVAQ